MGRRKCCCREADEQEEEGPHPNPLPRKWEREQEKTALTPALSHLSGRGRKNQRLKRKPGLLIRAHIRSCEASAGFFTSAKYTSAFCRSSGLGSRQRTET